MNYVPLTYQSYGTDHILNNEKCGLFMEMGLGKTVCTLTAIVELMHYRFDILKVLVIAPLNVAKYVWSDELEKWDHLKNLTYSHVIGPTPKQRIIGLNKKADIYLINRENVPWLQAHLAGAWPFDMIVVDESSSFKNHKSARFKALKLVSPKSSRIVLLSGTPAPNSLIDLWPQLFLLDRGERLGKKITGFRNRYFIPGKTNGHIVYSYTPRQETKENLYKKIGDICISLRAKDYGILPEKINRSFKVYLHPKIQQAYKEFERNAVLEFFDSDEPITAVNAATLCNKLVQFANGAIYTSKEDKSVWQAIHDSKLEALTDIIEAANGNPVMVFYWFKHDLQRIQQYLSAKKIDWRVLKNRTDVTDWNAKKISVFLLHPASAGHGLNLQAGGNIIAWFGLTWSLELYQQAVARLCRTGQSETVIVHHIIATRTMDERIMRVIQDKADGQDELLNAVNALKIMHLKNKSKKVLLKFGL